MDPGNSASNMAARWCVDGWISATDLSYACGVIMARHAALHSTVVELDGEPNQCVDPQLTLKSTEVDLTTLPLSAAYLEAEQIAQREARAPFDLSAPPLIRVVQLRIQEHLSIILITAHQMVCDRSSLAILAREIATLCAAHQLGRAAVLPKIGLNYEQCSTAKALRLDDSLIREHEQYWLQKLQGIKYFELPAARARQPVLNPSSSTLPLILDAASVKALHELSRGGEYSLFSIGLTALLSLLHRYTGETDIVIGSQTSGRDDQSLESIVGFFSNTILLRGDVSDEPTFVELLMRVRTLVTEALDHQSTPLHRLVELLRPQRDSSRNLLFSVNFGLQPLCVAAQAYGRFRLIDLPSCPVGVPYDLDFLLVESAEGWRISCDYHTDLFELETIERLLVHFANLLRTGLAAPATRIAFLPMLDTEETRVLLAGNRSSSTTYPPDVNLLTLFALQVQRTPNAIAVICGQQQLSYEALNHAVNRLAHRLSDLGIGCGSRVGVCIDRSLELLVSLLAVLKAGAAYIPLDPNYPIYRLAQIIEDAQPACVITKTALATRLPVMSGATLLLDAEAALISSPSNAEVKAQVAPDDVAYIIFTSGSTGRPKGVQIQHRALTNFLLSMQRQPGLQSSDTLVSVTTICFDIAVLELFLPLIVGARVVIARDDQIADGLALTQLLRRHQATVLQATPVVWRILLAAGWQAQPPFKMLCGGETLSRALADQLLQHGGELWNLYGPTETTVWSSAHRVENGPGPVPIGPPIDSTQFYVLDSQQQILPYGVPGELYIGGAGVALGYLNRPALNAERFLADPFSHLPHARLYRTGDRVRQRRLGGLEFLGRSDQQIKLRGFRIELGEIEAVLRVHPQLSDCVVAAGRDASGEEAILAYVVLHPTPVGEHAVVLNNLRASLRQALPAYMVPSVLTILNELPRTPNGKVDRAALPPPRSIIESAEKAGLPLSTLEQRLALIWSTVLGLPASNVDANFFEVGGHSLLAVKLLARIESEFGKRLSLATLFSNNTIAQQAKLLEHGDPHPFDFRQVLKLQAEGCKPPLIALNNTGIYYLLSKRLGLDQPFTSLQLFDPSQPQVELPQTLEEIAAGYIQLIRQVQPEGPYALLGWCVAGTLAFEVARQLAASGRGVSRLLLFDCLAPGHLSRLPWWAALLADYSLRWQLIAADWTRSKLDRHRLRTFLSHRATIRKLKAWWVNQPAVSEAELCGDKPLSLEQYDQWLLGYLEEVADRYQPEIYRGTMTLFRSSQQPSGPYIDPQMGWGALVEGGVEVVTIEGDHFSIFQEPSVSQIARCIESVLASGHGSATKGRGLRQDAAAPGS